MADGPRSNRPAPRTQAAVEAELRRRIRAELEQARSDADGQLEDATLASIIARAVAAAVQWHLEAPEHTRNATLSSRTWRPAGGPRGGRPPDTDDRPPREYEGRPTRDFERRPPRDFDRPPPRDYDRPPPRDFERPPRDYDRPPPRDFDRPRRDYDRDFEPGPRSDERDFQPRPRPGGFKRGGGGGFKRGGGGFKRGGFGPRKPPRAR